MRKIVDKLNRGIAFLDSSPLWGIGLIMLIITFLPYMILKEGSVFVIHDQLDETILSYVLNAKYLGTDVEMFPEMMGGLNKTSIQPSAILFVLLYKIFPTFIAFLIQYAIVVFSGYIGMYFLVKRVTGSSILSIAISICFCILPVQPVYGLSILGVPLVVYAFFCLYDRKRIILAYFLLLFFGLTTHIVLIGYVIIGLWICYIAYMLITKKRNNHIMFGFLFLLAVYIVVNHNLFIELIVNQNEFISHREEFVNQSMETWSAVKDLFLNSSQHAVSLHKKLILPICVMLLIEGCVLKKVDTEGKRIYFAAVAIFVSLLVIALIFGLCKSDIVTEWKNSMQGVLRYFQLERVYWLYPFLWFFEFALVVRIWWGNIKRLAIFKVGILIVLLIPTLQSIKVNSNFYMNINQINNGSRITGYISWESYYAEDLMQELEDAIGREKSTYRVAHLGISPTPSLMHGFYSVDGYSNNYSLEYKHKFRQVIAEELEKNEMIKEYFDSWGSRCYLFNHITGDYYWLSKYSNIQFENLEFDMSQLSELGCEYLFSGGEIIDAKDMGLELMGYFETEESYWGIWLYRLKTS